VHIKLPGREETTYVTSAVVDTAGQDNLIVLLLSTDCNLSGTSGAPSGVPLAVAATLVPYTFTPTTETLYSVPLTRDSIEQDVDVEVQLKLPGVAVAVYLVPAASPLPFSHEISRALFAGVATSFATARGTREKTVTIVEPAPVPIVLTPTTVIVYSVPTVRPVIEHPVEVEVHCDPPGIAVAV
jgi:hypothetical protein